MQQNGHFNLLTTPWLPVSHADGSQSIISPADLTSGDPANPALMPAWPRPDLNIATLEFLIGLFTIAFAPEEEEWAEFYINPPSKSELEAAFHPLVEAFWLDGPGPRFMQDQADLGEATIPIEALFIDSAGENTIVENKDLMVKRHRYSRLSRPSAAITLYASQQYAGVGGGHRDPLRGGGPLTTLILPIRTDGTPSTLWQIVWSNVICSDDGIPREEDLPRIFPWLAPTLTSEKGTSELHEKDPKAHPLQAFFGMPHRIRLNYQVNKQNTPCDLTGYYDEVIISFYERKKHGVNYGHWQHPLTPYHLKKNEISSYKAEILSLSFPNWAEISLKQTARSGDKNKGIIAKNIRQFQDLRRSLSIPDLKNQLPQAKLLVSGWAMNKAKPRLYILSEEPIHLHQNPAAQQELEKFAIKLVEAGKVACDELVNAIKDALKPKNNKKFKFKKQFIETIRTSFFSATNSSFHEGLGNALNIDPTEMTAREPIAARWREVLEAAALTLFDSYVNQDFRDPERARPVVKARSSLKRNLKSKKFKTALGLTEPKEKEGATA